MLSKKITALGTAAVLTFLSLTAFSSCKKDEPISEITEPPAESTDNNGTIPDSQNINPLTGEADFADEHIGEKPVAIVVENSPAARPQWGMSTPDILMEYEVEGGITRMLWLYADISRVPDKVGPVRSARHDIVELALGLDALFIHCGGSTFALDKIQNYSGTLSEIEGMQSQPFFERDSTRNVSSEHRLVLRGEGLREWVSSHNTDMTLKDAYKNPFSFNSSPAALSGGSCVSADISYSASYNYSFKYDAASGKYNCFLNSSERLDDSGTQCAYTNVIVLYVDMEALGTSSGHQDLKLENGGTGIYINGGKSEEIKWTKGNDTDRLTLLRSDGSPLYLNPGNSYIGFVRSTRAGQTALS